MGFGDDAREEEPPRIDPASNYVVDPEKQPGAPKFHIDPEEDQVEDKQGGPTQNEVEMQPGNPILIKSLNQQ